MFDKTYELSLNRNYVAHWGITEAIRELIQNQLDSESAFVYEFKATSDVYTLTLTSANTVLSPETLLLGSTSKADSDTAIGSFGEGYKIALLVLTRENIHVTIANGNKLWTPAFKYSSQFKSDLLVVNETKCTDRNKGLTFTIYGLSDADVSNVKASCLLMQDNIGAIKTTLHGEILLDRPGALFVGGLYICKTEHKYGYNILPKYIKLERDRQTVSSWDLDAITTKMWYATEEYDRIAEMIEAALPDVSYAQYSSTSLVREACYRLFRKTNPGAIAARSRQELEALVARGMEKVVVVGSGYYANVTSCQVYRKEERVAVESITDRLTRFLSANRSDMRTNAIVNFKEMIKEAIHWQRK